MVEICFAAAKTGMIYVPLNFRLVPVELKFVIDDAEIDILFVGEAFKKEIDVIKDEISVPHVIQMDSGYEPFMASASAEEPSIPVKPGDIFSIFYTSGTTGGPKGVILTHENFLAGVVNNTIAYKLGPSDVCLHVQPFYHTMQKNMVLCQFYVGGTNVIMNNFDGHEFWKSVERDGITHMTLVYTGLVMVLDALEEGKYSGQYSSSDLTLSLWCMVLLRHRPF